jgi:hypothetical protein
MNMANDDTAVTTQNGLPPFMIYTLRNEDAERAAKFVKDVLAVLKPDPGDVIALNWVCQHARNVWIVDRYDRVEALAIERRVEQSRDYQMQRAKEVKRRCESRIAQLATSAGEHPTVIARVVALERDRDAAVEEIDAIATRPVEDAECLRAIENTVETLEKFDFLKGQAIKRRDAAIERLEQWDAGFGKRLREAARQVLDAEFAEVSPTVPEVDAPPIAATQETNDAHPSQAAGQPQQ